MGSWLLFRGVLLEVNVVYIFNCIDLFQNTSVLEMHHWRYGVGLLQESGLFSHFSSTQWLVAILIHFKPQTTCSECPMFQL